jgi:tetratricopeptide (TPR) repeat protein
MAIATALCLGKLCISGASMLSSAFSDAPLERIRDILGAFDSGNEAFAKLRGAEATTLHKALAQSKIAIQETYESSLRHSHSAGFREAVETAFANLGEVFESCVPSGQDLARLRHDPEAIANKVADNAVARNMPFFKSGEGRKILVSLVVLAYTALDKNPEFMATLRRVNWSEAFEQLAEIRAKVESLGRDTEKLLAFAQDERRRLGIAEGFVHEMAGRIASSHALDLEAKMQAVRGAIEIYVSEIAGGRTHTNLGDIVDRALAGSRALVDEGKSGLARATLRRAAESLKSDEEDRRARYAESVSALYGRERDIALAVSDGDAAAEAVIAMGDALHPSDRVSSRGVIDSEARVAYDHGDERGSNVHLVVAIALQRRLLETARGQNERGSALSNLGNALSELGEREGGAERLEEAVAAHRAALQEYTRERAPSEWAMTQNNLGNALLSLGEPEGATVRLEEAVAAYRAALQEYTRERAPSEWAMTQNNLGSALLSLGEPEGGTVRLEEAVAAYREALQELTRERLPRVWATTQNNLGNALFHIGQRENGTESLEQAVAAYREALQELTRQRLPLDWATTQSNLGDALSRLGEREGGTARLEQAVVAFRAALEERTRERVPLAWAATQNNLGIALFRLGERENGTEKLEQAVAAYRELLEDRTRERAPLKWAASLSSQGVAMILIADRTNNSLVAEAAVLQIQSAYEMLRLGGPAPLAARYLANLTQAQAIRDRLKGK